MTIRYKRPDQKNALSIIEAAEREMKFTLSIKPSEESSSTIIRNVYECLRMLGDALLVSKGIKSQDHTAPIQELTAIQADTKRPINLVSNLKRLRHNINYYGYKPNMFDVKDTISIAESIFEPVLKAVKAKIKEIR